MKTRNDFVSNSSSSSFICTLADNKFQCLLSDFRVLTLESYFKEFGDREISDQWCYGIEDADMKFVSPQEYSSRFSNGVAHVLPMTAKSLYEEYSAQVKRRKELHLQYGSKELEDALKAEDAIFSMIKEKCVEALKLEWRNERFCYSEVSDNFILDDDDSLSEEEAELKASGCNNLEEMTEERFMYINGLKPLKFMRIYSNH